MRESWFRLKRHGLAHLVTTYPLTLEEKFISHCGLTAATGRVRLIHQPTRLARCKVCEQHRQKASA